MSATQGRYGTLVNSLIRMPTANAEVLLRQSMASLTADELEALYQELGAHVSTPRAISDSYFALHLTQLLVIVRDQKEQMSARSNSDLNEKMQRSEEQRRVGQKAINYGSALSNQIFNSFKKAWG